MLYKEPIRNSLIPAFRVKSSARSADQAKARRAAIDRSGAPSGAPIKRQRPTFAARYLRQLDRCLFSAALPGRTSDIRKKHSLNVKSVTSCGADAFYIPAGTRVHQEDTAIMKTMLAVLAVLGPLALATSGANAYQSRANGYQSYPNYDRQEYVNRSCCSWKTSHKAKAKPAKH